MARKSWYDTVTRALTTPSPTVTICWRDDSNTPHTVGLVRNRCPSETSRKQHDAWIDVALVFLDDHVVYGSYGVKVGLRTTRIVGDGSYAQLAPLMHGLYLKRTHYDISRSDGIFRGPPMMYLCGWKQITGVRVEDTAYIPAPTRRRSTLVHA